MRPAIRYRAATGVVEGDPNGHGVAEFPIPPANHPVASDMAF
jgi:hypothetical protein